MRNKYFVTGDKMLDIQKYLICIGREVVSYALIILMITGNFGYFLITAFIFSLSLSLSLSLSSLLFFNPIALRTAKTQ